MLKKKLLKWAIVPVVAAIAFFVLSSFVDGGEEGGAEEDKRYYASAPYSCKIYDWRPKPGGGMEYVYVGMGLQDDCPRTTKISSCTRSEGCKSGA